MDEDERRIVQVCISALLLLVNKSETTEAFRQQQENVVKELLLLAAPLPARPESDGTQENGKIGETAISFTEKEILKMPKQFRKLFRQPKGDHIRLRENGVYEIRFQFNKIKITVSSKSLATAKQKFIKQLCEAAARGTAEPPVPTAPLLTEYMLQWLDTVKKPLVKPITFKAYTQNIRAYVIPEFTERKIDGIRHFELQTFINGFVEKENFRTAKKLYQLLSAVFDYAVADEVLPRSPMAKVKMPHYEQLHGVPLSRAEEKVLLDPLREDPAPYIQAFVFMLYTGIRRSELASVQIADGWIRLTTSKQRKGYREKTRSLPVSPMLGPNLPFIDVAEIVKVSPAVLTKRFKQLFPTHHLHDLRHTFITRAQECGIQRELVSLWAGHAADNTMTSNVYTHFSREFMLKEAKKVIYNLSMPI